MKSPIHNGAPFGKAKEVLHTDNPGEGQRLLGEAYRLLHQVRLYMQASGARVYGLTNRLKDGSVVRASVYGEFERVDVWPPGTKDQPPEPDPFYDDLIVPSLLAWKPTGFVITPRSPSMAPDGWGLPDTEDGLGTPGGPVRQVMINRLEHNNYPDFIFKRLNPDEDMEGDDGEEITMTWRYWTPLLTPEDIKPTRTLNGEPIKNMHRVGIRDDRIKAGRVPDHWDLDKIEIDDLPDEDGFVEQMLPDMRDRVREKKQDRWFCHRPQLMRYVNKQPHDLPEDERLPKWQFLVEDDVLADIHNATNQLRAEVGLPDRMPPIRGIGDGSAYTVLANMQIASVQAHSYPGYYSGYQTANERTLRHDLLGGEILAYATSSGMASLMDIYDAEDAGFAIVDAWRDSPGHYQWIAFPYALISENDFFQERYFSPAKKPIESDNGLYFDSGETGYFSSVAQSSVSKIAKTEIEPYTGGEFLEHDPADRGVSAFSQVFSPRSSFIKSGNTFWHGKSGSLSWNNPSSGNPLGLIEPRVIASSLSVRNGETNAQDNPHWLEISIAEVSYLGTTIPLSYRGDMQGYSEILLGAGLKEGEGGLKIVWVSFANAIYSASTWSVQPSGVILRQECYLYDAIKRAADFTGSAEWIKNNVATPDGYQRDVFELPENAMALTAAQFSYDAQSAVFSCYCFSGDEVGSYDYQVSDFSQSPDYSESRVPDLVKHFRIRAGALEQVFGDQSISTDFAHIDNYTPPQFADRDDIDQVSPLYNYYHIKVTGEFISHVFFDGNEVKPIKTLVDIEHRAIGAAYNPGYDLASNHNIFDRPDEPASAFQDNHLGQSLIWPIQKYKMSLVYPDGDQFVYCDMEELTDLEMKDGVYSWSGVPDWDRYGPRPDGGESCTGMLRGFFRSPVLKDESNKPVAFHQMDMGGRRSSNPDFRNYNAQQAHESLVFNDEVVWQCHESSWPRELPKITEYTLWHCDSLARTPGDYLKMFIYEGRPNNSPYFAYGSIQNPASSDLDAPMDSDWSSLGYGASHPVGSHRLTLSPLMQTHSVLQGYTGKENPAIARPVSCGIPGGQESMDAMICWHEAEWIAAFHAVSYAHPNIKRTAPECIEPNPHDINSLSNLNDSYDSLQAVREGYGKDPWTGFSYRSSLDLRAITGISDLDQNIMPIGVA